MAAETRGWRGLGGCLLPAGRRFIGRDGPRHGAAVAFYTLFSLAPLLVVVTAGVALLLGTDEAHAAIYAYLERFFGESEAKAMKSLADAALARVTGPGIAAWIAIGTTVVGASAVFLELQAALRRLDVLRHHQQHRIPGVHKPAGNGSLLVIFRQGGQNCRPQLLDSSPFLGTDRHRAQSGSFFNGISQLLG